MRLNLTAAKDAFKAFDKKNENKIKVGDLEAAMKRLGHTIKPDWLEKVEHMIDSAGNVNPLTPLTPTVAIWVQPTSCARPG